MPESIVQVTSGVGPKLHTWQRTVGANNVEDEFVIAGMPPLATYTFAREAVSIATASSHVLQIMAGASLNVYLLRIQAFQDTLATTGALCGWSLRRLTTAGTGGTSLGSGTPHDTTDAASGAQGMVLPTVKGTEGVVPIRQAGWAAQAPGATGINWKPIFEWSANEMGIMKPIRIPAGAANGIALRNETAVAAATVIVLATFMEGAF